jgi:hypothetical protein
MLEVPSNDTMLTIQDAITRRIPWRMTYIDVDPSAVTSASTIASQSNIAHALIFPKTRPSLSPIQEQPCPSPIREQPQLSPPRTRSTPLPTPNQTWPPTVMPKKVKNVRGKIELQQQKMSSKATKGKQPLQQMTDTTQANINFVMGRPMLTVDELDKASQPYIDLHNYYIQNYKSDQDIIVSYKDHHFLVGDNIFIITFTDLYDFFNLDVFDVSLMRCFVL